MRLLGIILILVLVASVCAEPPTAPTGYRIRRFELDGDGHVSDHRPYNSAEASEWATGIYLKAISGGLNLGSSDMLRMTTQVTTIDSVDWMETVERSEWATGSVDFAKEREMDSWYRLMAEEMTIQASIDAFEITTDIPDSQTRTNLSTRCQVLIDEYKSYGDALHSELNP